MGKGNKKSQNNVLKYISVWGIIGRGSAFGLALVEVLEEGNRSSLVDREKSLFKLMYSLHRLLYKTYFIRFIPRTT